jgi:hypothetical protein
LRNPLDEGRVEFYVANPRAARLVLVYAAAVAGEKIRR